uniref:Uncharacterized protein n=1 Tax=Strigamia maritima TaxID=126957 RepID=T1JLY9_STRMM
MASSEMTSFYDIEELKKCVSLNVQILEKLQKMTNNKDTRKNNGSDDETVRLLVGENQLRVDVDPCFHSQVDKDMSGFIMTICVIVLVLLIICIIALCSNHLHFHHCC